MDSRKLKFNVNKLNNLFSIDFNQVDWKDLKLLSDKKISLLIVDDERSFRELLKEIFIQKDAYEVDLAENGLEALNKYKEKKYDIILTDVMMDTMTGVEMANSIRRINPDQKIFFFSGWVSNSNLYERFEDEFAEGFYQFIEKPFDIEEFQNKIYLFKNDNIKNIKLDLLNEEKVKEVLDHLTPYQIVAIHKSIWNLCIKLSSELLEEEIGRKELIRSFIPTSNYMLSVGCTYKESYCRANICMNSSPNCASEKLRGQIDALIANLHKIYNKYISNNTIEYIGLKS